jgi:hypothetical protein
VAAAACIPQQKPRESPGQMPGVSEEQKWPKDIERRRKKKDE